MGCTHRGEGGPFETNVRALYIMAHARCERRKSDSVWLFDMAHADALAVDIDVCVSFSVEHDTAHRQSLRLPLLFVMAIRR